MAAGRATSPSIAALVGGLCLAGAAPLPVSAYDIDCKLILCMAGGFPAGCADAKSYMIDRITSVPPKPPIGFCARAGVAAGAAAGYDAYEVDYRFLSMEAEAWDCPPGKRIQLIESDFGRGGRRYMGAGCFDEALRTCSRGRNAACWTTYLGEVPAIRYDMKFEITIEPATADEFRSGVHYLSFR
ncbi:MAG: hypothetical protein AAF322_00060 [Pseudomonadota bacterium]